VDKVSTTIYNGYRTKETNMAKILEKLISFREVVDKCKSKTIMKYCSGKCKKVINGEMMVCDFTEEVTKLLDFTFNIVLFPTEKHTLIIDFGGRIYSKIIPELIKVLELEEYGYWNNTDWPDNVTFEEWEQREQDWKDVLLKYPGAIPGECGFIYELSSNNISYSQIVDMFD
jgi:hypothetical protein